MNPFKHLDEPSLVNKFTEYTIRYSKFIKEPGDDQEFNDCRMSLEYIMLEIEVRRSTKKRKELVM